ncbi:MAG: hypothetical protein RPR97_06650 [Colwellia sp.]
MRKNCQNDGCAAPKGLCLKSSTNEHLKCETWLEKNPSIQIGETKKTTDKSICLPWTGEALQPEDISIISERSVPLIVGMVGTADAGKTSFLGMIYTLLFNGGRIKNWGFSGSTTLAAWETLAQYLKITNDGSVNFPAPTSSHPDFYSLYHLALKNDNTFRDVLFADSSGEVFSDWSEDINDDNAENARWIYKSSSAFIFMVDSEALIEKRGRAVSEIVQMAGQLAANLNSRPVVIVWTKSDREAAIKPAIKASIEEDLSELFPESISIKVSNFPKSGKEKICHLNNLLVIESVLLELNRPAGTQFEIPVKPACDYFLDYRAP